MPEEQEVREVHPFKVINRGEDTVVGDDDNVVFSDFSPKVVPSSTPEREVEKVVDPKVEFAPEPAASETLLTPPTEPTSLATPVPAPADSDTGKSKSDDPTSPSSSTDPKSGQDEPPA